ncbi:MAG: excinuclease ABC subunit UvrC [Candidatus Atribacteria bacterium]|nr:excinuclease ABC subunit UvrC [Candidatus Atribacteria bacterium]
MNISEKLKQLPQKSGVYFFKDKQGVIIYIGKAISLKNRVSSYFSKSHAHSEKISKMIEKIDDLEYITTASEMEALLLESRMVKKNEPYFNTQLKDDKSYPFIRLSKEHPFPSIQVIRKNKGLAEKKACYYGPFVDVEVTRRAVKKLRQIFKIRNCSDRKFKIGKTCLDYQIGLCSAPCAGKISREDYQKKIEECCLILSGRNKLLLKRMKQEMKAASQLMLYEKAAEIRDTVKMIESVISQEKISRSYHRKIDAYSSKIEDESSLEKSLTDLQVFLNLPSKPDTIEAYDISNIHGQLSVGSMVRFKSGIPDKKMYRHFKIKEIQGINDYAMMREVIYRRFQKESLKKHPLPDLVLLDGGKGQLNAVHDLLKEIGLQVNLVALAKREEELFQIEKKEPIQLPENSGVFFLIQRIRDEAHRFAIRYHKKLRNKSMTRSMIDFIPGVGEKRRTQLLLKFKSIEQIRNADINELTKVSGVGKKTAHKIKDILEVRGDSKVW